MRTIAPLALGLLLVTDSVVTAQTAPGSRSLPAVVLVSLAAPILFGSGLALVLHSPTGFRIAARAIGRCWMPAVLLAAVLAAVAIAAAEPVIAFAMALLVASCCLREDHALSPLLRAVPLRSIGVISYGVYLLHQLSANAVQAALEVPKGPVLFLATLPPALLVSWFSHRFFERPMVVLKHRFTRDVAAAIPSPGMPTVPPGLRAAEAQP